MNGLDVIDAARQLIGVPFVRQGLDPNVGLDCVGLIAAVGSILGVGSMITTPVGYRQLTKIEQGVEWAQRCGLHSTTLEWSPGRVVLLEQKRRSSHMAIATDRGLIEASNAPGVRQIVEVPSRDDSTIRAAFTYPGVG